MRSIATFLIVPLLAPLLAVAGLSGCKPPGAHQCAIIVYADGYGGVDGSQSSGRDVSIVGGSCDSIQTSGTFDPQGVGKGFYGNFGTSYGPHIKVWASYVGLDGISGVNMLYDDGGSHNVWRYQNNGDCFGGTYGFDPAVRTLQCNFPC